MPEIELGFVLLLVITGLIAGVINTLAGGGSNLTVPALMVMGMPADVANATNRVGVLIQNIAGVRGFHQNNALPTNDLPAVLLPMILGGAGGALMAAFLPASLVKPILLGAMLTMTIIMLVKPSTIFVEPGTIPSQVKDKPQAFFWLLLAGFYGGFVQAGVGFIQIAVLAGALRYDLVGCNALKMLGTLLFTIAAVAIFMWQGLIAWVPGLILAVGTATGAHFAVKFAISADPKVLKWLLFFMTLAGTIAALLTD